MENTSDNCRAVKCAQLSEIRNPNTCSEHKENSRFKPRVSNSPTQDNDSRPRLTASRGDASNFGRKVHSYGTILPTGSMRIWDLRTVTQGAYIRVYSTETIGQASRLLGCGNDAGANSILRKFTQIDVNFKFISKKTPKKAHSSGPV